MFLMCQGHLKAKVSLLYTCI